MQQPAQMLPMIPNYPPTNITTEQIQKYLDENKKLILAILDNQNLGKLAECAQYQAQLQKNLMYLAAIADSQPPTATMPGQIASHPDMQQPGGGFYMQHPQAAAAAAAMAQQAGIFSQKMPLQFNNSPQHQQYLHQHHQQAAMMMQGQLGIRPNVGMANNGMQQHSSSHAAEAGGGSSKQDGSDGNGGGGDGDSSFKKGSEDK
ncbi:GRF1-interacting factor 2-like [Impatiens glandulifera]|uniref:GRF1-interacting factor 2-like n=1 Tax=Impatiens glandulifera TaxID=253017 RepID=UPI001FB0D3FF|nr:GRF1-interacting factor 2-like [Impatiens glandulifera]